MRNFVLAFLASLMMTAAGVSAETEANLLKQEWPKLAGTWAGPLRRYSPDNTEPRRPVLVLRKLGKDHLFEEYEEYRTANGATERVILHSAMLVIEAIREKDRKRYLIVRPKTEPPVFEAMEIHYEFAKGQLKLQGSLGSSRLTGEWSRVKNAR